MIKQIGLLTRRPGMSVAEFREYYENQHRLLGEKYLAGHACHYARRFPIDPAAVDFDVILEVWYPSAEAYAAARQVLDRPEVQAEIIADEEQLFDRSKHRFFQVEECVSDLPAVS